MLALACLTPSAAAEGQINSLLARIKAVGREGAGNIEAGQAWRELAKLGPESLPAILAGFTGADAAAANWLRTAVDAIAERALKAKQPLPAVQLEAFVLKKEHQGAARRLAYEWLARVDAMAPDRLLPGMLFDPSSELRRDAVERVIKEGQKYLDKGNKATAMQAFRKALAGARDRDQVALLAQKLKTLGVTVDLRAHFGFVQKWMVLAPFDNTQGIGFQTVYPPEKGIELAATYQGKKGAPLRWREYLTTDPYGLVDLNKVIGKHMGVVGYAYAAVVSPADQVVQIRAGSNNAVKIFLNGKQLFFREEYHHGMEMDQHVGAGTLKAGRNEILIKICQNEQADEWAQSWSFQMRVCDALGGAVPLALAAEGKVRP